jgi:hypothetical protein
MLAPQLRLPAFYGPPSEIAELPVANDRFFAGARFPV